MTLRTAALCAGYGGLEMGLTIAGVDHDLAWYSELDDAPACDLLNIRTGAPNLGDLTTIHDPPEVDIVTAGFPCQPFSQAGLRKGVEDERFLIDDVCRVAANARARWLILENVAGILSANDGRALSRVCEALARSGFVRWEWGTLRASDVGACHQRRRWFCVARVADADSLGCQRAGATRDGWFGFADDSGEHVDRLPTPRTGSNRNSRQSMVEKHSMSGPGLEQALEWAQGIVPRELSYSEAAAKLPTPTVGDSGGAGSALYSTDSGRHSGTTLTDATVRLPEQFGKYTAAIERHEVLVGRPAPAPTVDSRLNPVFVEWMMGIPEGHVTDLDLSRAKKVHILGNGVVPQQAAAAITALS